MQGFEEAMSDKSRHKDMMSNAPLPLQYPANLIHAQKMYAISMAQLLRVEQQINELQFQLRERDLRLTSSAAALLAAVSLQVKEPEIARVHVEVDRQEPRGGVQGQADGQEAAMDGAQPPEERPRHRQRLFNATKIALVMLLFEFSTGWFFVYFFGVCMYIGGVFDPIIEWVQRRPTRVALEQQLNGLRNRQRHDDERIIASAQAPRAENEEAPQAAENKDNGDSDGMVSANEETNDSVSGGLQDSVEETPTAEGTLTAPANDNMANADQPPYWHRFIYQLFVMFFLTLLPWWNPDPRYL